MDQLVFEKINYYFWWLVNGLGGWLLQHGLRIVIIIIVAWLAKKFGAQIIMRFLEKTVRKDLYPTKSDRTKRLNTLRSLISAILHFLAVVIAGLLIIDELGINTTPVIASAGIIGVALGFGAQSLIRDLTSGLFIIIENQYRVGDVIELNNGVAGKVEAITIRTTQVRALDGTLFHVPNGNVLWTANKTSNYSGFDENLTFPNDVDIDKLAIVINRTGEILAKKPEYEKKIKQAPYFLRIVGFDGTGVSVKIAGKTGSDDAWEIKGEFYKLLIKELRKSKMPLPNTPPGSSKEKKPTTNPSASAGSVPVPKIKL